MALTKEIDRLAANICFTLSVQVTINYKHHTAHVCEEQLCKDSP